MANETSTSNMKIIQSAKQLWKKGLNLLNKPTRISEFDRNIRKLSWGLTIILITRRRSTTAPATIGVE